MDFTLNESQQMLKDSVERLLADSYTFAKRGRYISEPDGWSRDRWRSFAEMGLLGLPFAESLGGFAGGPVETMIVMEAFGGSLVVEPYVPTVLLGGGLIDIAGSAEQRKRLIPRIVEGDLLAAFAQAEPRSRYDLNHVETKATSDGEGWLLNGHKRHVFGGDSADILIISARVAGNIGDEDGIALFLVEPDSKGVSRRGYRLQDHTRAAEVRLENVRVDPENVLGVPRSAAALIAQTTARTISALCCEAVGAMSAAHRMTIEYLKTRKQFGSPLGSFQALRHRAVDMYVQLELARSMAMHAIVSGASDDLSERELAASSAKVTIGEAGRQIGSEAVQMHGGIGMTEEYPVGHYYRRLTMIEMMFGDTAHHRARIASAGGLIEPATHALL